MDTKQVALGTGKVVYQFGAVDWFTRKRVMALAPRLTSHYGAESLRQVVAQFPFPALALQSHGGSEFLKEFEATVAQLRLTHYFNGPNYSQGNGTFEWTQRTHTEEFYPCMTANWTSQPTTVLCFTGRVSTTPTDPTTHCMAALQPSILSSATQHRPQLHRLICAERVQNLD